MTDRTDNEQSPRFRREVIALEGRLRDCRNVKTLGVRPNFSDYPTEEADLIRNASRVYYPSSLYAELFHAMGIPIFPSLQTYAFAQDKIKQTALFALLEIPHPRTRVYYGKRQMARIMDDFLSPFVAKVPRGSAMGRGVFLIRSSDDLTDYLSQYRPAYIQEYLPIDRDARVVIIGRKVVHTYWRVAEEGEFRSNLAAGGTVDLSPVPGDMLDLALHTAGACGWNDVGLDICRSKGKLYVLEANMKYGKAGFRSAGIDYPKLMERLIDNDQI